jgi:hypothetical protein
MSCDDMIHIPSFKKVDSGTEKLIGGYTGIQTRRQQGDFINLLLFLKNKKSRPKINHGKKTTSRIFKAFYTIRSKLSNREILY